MCIQHLGAGLFYIIARVHGQVEIYSVQCSGFNNLIRTGKINNSKRGPKACLVNHLQVSKWPSSSSFEWYRRKAGKATHAYHPPFPAHRSSESRFAKHNVVGVGRQAVFAFPSGTFLERPDSDQPEMSNPCLKRWDGWVQLQDAPSALRPYRWIVS